MIALALLGMYLAVPTPENRCRDLLAGARVILECKQDPSCMTSPDDLLEVRDRVLLFHRLECPNTLTGSK